MTQLTHDKTFTACRAAIDVSTGYKCDCFFLRFKHIPQYISRRWFVVESSAPETACGTDG